MRTSNLQKEIRALPLARKLVLAASLLTLLFLFFPWGTRGVQGEGYEFIPAGFNAFGIFPIFGWLLLIITAATFALVWREMVTHKTTYRKFNHSLLWMLLGGIGVYTILIALFVFNSTYLKGFDSQFSMKVGVFLTLFMQILIIFAGTLGRRDEERDYMRQALSRPYEVDTSKAHLEPEELPDSQMSLGDYDHKR